MGSVFKDYSKINVTTPEGHAAFMGCVQAAMAKPYKSLETVQAKIKELATANQFPDTINDMLQKFKVGRGEIDLSWMQVFDVVDLTNVVVSSYKIVDVQNGVSFKKVPQGEKAEIYSLQGKDVDISFDKYGAGLQYPQDWYEDQRWWDIEETTEDYKLAWWEDLATIMFALIEDMPDGLYDGTTDGVDAGDGCNIKYDSGGSTTLQQDINTINDGVISLLNANKTTLRLNATSPLVLMCNISRYDRCRAAVERIRSDAYTGPEMISKNITVVPTLGLTTTGKWEGTDEQDTSDELPLGYLCVPKRKNKFLKRKDLTIYPARFIERVYATEIMAWGRHGGFASSAQFRRLLGSDDD